jgi:hypothetical protein
MDATRPWTLRRDGRQKSSRLAIKRVVVRIALSANSGALPTGMAPQEKWQSGLSRSQFGR